MSLDWMFGGPRRPNPDRDSAYLGPDPVFRNWPVATGPGMHTDEASSALPAIGKLLSSAERDALSGPRPNGAYAETYAEKIAPFGDLIPIAYAVTGTWGAVAGSYRSLYNDLSVRRLPLLNQPPRENPRLGLGFWERMQQLKNELTAFRDKITGRYDRTRAQRVIQSEAKRAAQRAAQPTRKVSNKPPKDAWLFEVDKMLSAVQFVLDQEVTARVSGVLRLCDSEKLPLGRRWNVLAEGNGKLPFMSYSELPMATCPGAGDGTKGGCGVSLKAHDPKIDKKDRPKAGWCYSFGSWVYPASFTRQFLSTLANVVDREAAIYRGSRRSSEKHPGWDEANPIVYAARVRAAIIGADGREWMQYVKRLALEQTRANRAGGRVVFVRLFVDGDMGYEDSILAWMEACRDTGAGARDILAGEGHVSWYGYSKAWGAFINANRYLGTRPWPANYTVNMSSGSFYAEAGDGPNRQRNLDIATEMAGLTISRGYFEAIKIGEYIPDLKRQTDLLIAAAKAAGKSPRSIVIPMPTKASPVIAGLSFKADRIRDFALLQHVQTKAEVQKMFPFANLDALNGKRGRDPKEVMHYALNLYLDKLSWDPQFGALIRRELLFDDPPNEKSFIKRYAGDQKRLMAQAFDGGGRIGLFAEYEREQKTKLSKTSHATEYQNEQVAMERAKVARQRAKARADRGLPPLPKKPKPKQPPGVFGTDDLRKKGFALVMHEAIWSFGLGGSCPLICGNCSDHTTDPLLGVHRCASRSTMEHKTIRIGIH